MIMAASYRLLQDHFINNVLLLAGQIVTEGIELPLAWKPTSAVDPINSDGVAAVWNLGPISGAAAPVLIRQQWDGIPIAAPVTFWKPFQSPNVNNLWVLTGNGTGLGPRQGNSGT
jgi:hypothetical protein